MAEGTGTGEGGDAGAAAAAAAAEAATASAANPWGGAVDGLSAEDKGFIENKGFSDLSSTLSSYRNLETLIGIPKDEILRMPKDGDPELMKQVYAKLGVPAEAAGYNDAMAVPEGQDSAFRDSMSPLFHKANISVDQARDLTTGWNEMIAAREVADQTDYSNKLAAEKQELTTLWGNAYDDKMLQGKGAMQEFGIPDEVVSALEKEVGFSKTLQVFAKIGAALGEGNYIGDQGGKGDSMTPEAARAELAQLKADPLWVAKYTDGNVEARATMDKLQRMINASA